MPYKTSFPAIADITRKNIIGNIGFIYSDNDKYLRKEMECALNSIKFENYWNTFEQKFTYPISYYNGGYALKQDARKPVDFFIAMFDTSNLSNQQITMLRKMIASKLGGVSISLISLAKRSGIKVNKGMPTNVFVDKCNKLIERKNRTK